MDNQLETVNIVQIVDHQYCNKKDVVVTETPLTIFVNDQELVTLLCTPTHQKKLAVGFLFSEGFLTTRDEIEHFILNENKGIVWIRLNRQFDINENFRKSRTVTSGCARGLTFHKVFDDWNGEFIASKLTVSAEMISDIVAKLKQNSSLFRQSGGTHCSMLFERDNFLFSCEDIGRHNTIDKIIGECLLKELPGDDKLIMTSGRISSEMLLKTSRWGFPILVSRSAPTLAAVKLAEELGVTLIGFARGKRMNVYANDWRVKMDSGQNN